MIVTSAHAKHYNQLELESVRGSCQELVASERSNLFVRTWIVWQSIPKAIAM
jgi:hypothetical protein